MRLFSVLVVTILSTAFCAFAEKENELTKIIIQGATRTTSEEELPSSSTVITGHTIAGRGIQHTQDLVDRVPDLSAAGGSNRFRFFQIRGVGEFEQYVGAPNPSVGFFVDGVDLSGLGSIGTLFDIEQVEVLKGPQATRLGSSALAGAISIVSKEPDYIPSGKIEFTPGTDDLMSGGFAVGSPVDGTDGKLRVRFSAFHLGQNGFRDNVYLNRENTNKREETVVRGKAVWNPDRDLEIEAVSFYALADNGYDAFTIDNSFTTRTDKPGQDYQGTTANLLKVSYALSDELKLKNTASISNTSQKYSFDGDWGNNPFWGANASYDYFERTNRLRNTISNELRLESNIGSKEKTGWLIGAFVQRLKESADNDQRSNDETYNFLDSDYTANTKALFSQIEVPLPSDFSFIGAGRFEQREMEYRDSKIGSLDPTNNMVGGSASLLYRVDEHKNLYFTVSRGFKGGGFNTGAQILQDKVTFNPEYLWNIETGIKANFLEDKLNLNASIFYMLRRNQQVKFSSQLDPNDPLSFVYLTDNAARGTNAGAEIDIAYHVTPKLKLQASGALLGTEFSDYNAGGRDLKGRGQAYSSPWQYSALARYYFIDRLFLEGNFTGRGAYYFSDSDSSRSDPYSLFNSVLGYEGESWSLKFWGRNIFDKNYAVRGFYFGVEPPDYPSKVYTQKGDPRLLGVTVSLSF